MFALIGQVVASFAFIIKFIKSYLVKYATHGAILTLQFAITATTISFVMGFYFFTITSFVYLYNTSIEIVNYFVLNTDSSLSCMYGLLNTIGFLPALSNGITMFYTALGSILVFNLFKFTYGAMKVIKDEIFKLGVLLGQAVN